ncbi:MAG: hypothetical protein ACP5FL_01670 [Thermoplasmatota archaeon]
MVDLQSQRGTRTGIYAGTGHTQGSHSLRCIRLKDNLQASLYGPYTRRIWADFRAVYDTIDKAHIQQGDKIRVTYQDEDHIKIEKI